MKIKWYMIPEMWSTTGLIFPYFGPFFDLLPPAPPSPSLTSQWIKIEKMKKIPGDVIILTSVP